MILAPQAIVQFAKGAGFEGPLLATMCAIALRESGGDPNAHNGNAATGDDSWGLWQINWKVPQIQTALKAKGILLPSQLLDPATNARAAYILYGGKLSNLKLAWYIYDGLPQHKIYQDRYESHLAVAQWAALQVELGVVAT